MERELALHQITAVEASPAELVSLAAVVGCQRVCVFTYVPATALPDGSAPGAPFPLVTRENLAEVKAAMAQTGVGVGNIEFFPIAADVPAETYREAFALGQEIGALRAVVHIHDPDDSSAVAQLGEVADLAAEFDMSLGLEFMGLTPACNSVQRAAWFAEAAGRTNVGIAVDALHLARTGGKPADLLDIPVKYFSYGQICDGHGLHLSADYLTEALDREMPGDGDFPLLEMIEAMPYITALDVEVPSPTRADRGIPAIDRVREAVARSRAIIERARVTR
jgi:sugar phosphate isomerase/epimerase